MKEDKNYCMSSFLQFRCIADRTKTFKQGIVPWYPEEKERTPIHSSEELEQFIAKYIEKNYDEHTALMLSGGIDSIILASFLPKGAKVYTLKCIADVPTIDETIRAKEIADMLGLEHSIIEITWDDYLQYAPVLMKHKGAPIHSIEVQIYKAALQAQKDGYTKLLFGESADCLYGGFDRLLQKDWLFDEFVERYNFVCPKNVLKEPMLITEPYEFYRVNDSIKVHDFMKNFFYKESVGSYANACCLGNVQFLSPYAQTYMNIPLDLERVRNGDSKYFIREIFRKRFPDILMGKKIPMPRPVDRWLKNWEGPKRSEFLPDCIKDLSGDQKWMVYSLECFLNLSYKE